MRLIDADALMKAFYKSIDDAALHGGKIVPFQDIIQNAPTIDAVPVVRCKDCRHWTEWGSKTGSCSRFALDWIGTDADDFCSMAERRDDE